MTDSKHTVSTAALLAQQPHRIDPQALQDHLLNGVHALDEMVRYELATAYPDGHMGLADLAQYDTTPSARPAMFPGIRKAIEEVLTARMSAEGRRADDTGRFDNEIPSAVPEGDRCEEFRANPGLYLPGATTSTIRRIGRQTPLDGLVDVGGVTYPWLFCPMGIGPIAIADASHFIAKAGGAVEIVLLVSTHVKEGVEIPDYLHYVEVR